MNRRSLVDVLPHFVVVRSNGRPRALPEMGAKGSASRATGSTLGGQAGLDCPRAVWPSSARDAQTRPPRHGCATCRSTLSLKRPFAWRSADAPHFALATGSQQSLARAAGGQLARQEHISGYLVYASRDEGQRQASTCSRGLLHRSCAWLTQGLERGPLLTLARKGALQKLGSWAWMGPDGMARQWICIQHCALPRPWTFPMSLKSCNSCEIQDHECRQPQG